MRIGIDTYSYHRLLGEVRPGEREPGGRLAGGTLGALAECRCLGVDGASLETCFLDPPARLDAGALTAAAGGLELTIAWGHPHGLAFGADPSAERDLLEWIGLAPRLGARLVRLVAAGPRFRGAEPVRDQIARTAPPLRRAAAAARSAGVALAIENHADLTAAEMLRLIEAVGDDVLGVCLDTANALRVGDDPAAAARDLAPHVRQVHLKDCAPGWDDPVAGPASVPYGTGVVPLGEVLDAVAAGGSGGLVCVELGHLGAGDVDERRMVADAVRWLRERRAG